MPFILLELFVAALTVTFVVTQWVIPVFRGTQTFPLFRTERKVMDKHLRTAAEQAELLRLAEELRRKQAENDALRGDDDTADNGMFTREATTTEVSAAEVTPAEVSEVSTTAPKRTRKKTTTTRKRAPRRGTTGGFDDTTNNSEV